MLRPWNTQTKTEGTWFILRCPSLFTLMCQMECFPQTNWIHSFRAVVKEWKMKINGKCLETRRISGESAGWQLGEPSELHTGLGRSFTLRWHMSRDRLRLANGARGLTLPESLPCDELWLTALLNLPPAQSKTPVKQSAKKILHCFWSSLNCGNGHLSSCRCCSSVFANQEIAAASLASRLLLFSLFFSLLNSCQTRPVLSESVQWAAPTPTWVAFSGVIPRCARRCRPPCPSLSTVSVYWSPVRWLCPSPSPRHDYLFCRGPSWLILNSLAPLFAIFCVFAFNIVSAFFLIFLLSHAEHSSCVPNVCFVAWHTWDLVNDIAILVHCCLSLLFRVTGRA